MKSNSSQKNSPVGQLIEYSDGKVEIELCNSALFSRIMFT